jgi:hypothetical protein
MHICPDEILALMYALPFFGVAVTYIKARFTNTTTAEEEADG